jgi:hypothetical protein
LLGRNVHRAVGEIVQSWRISIAKSCRSGIFFQTSRRGTLPFRVRQHRAARTHPHRSIPYDAPILRDASDAGTGATRGEIGILRVSRAFRRTGRLPVVHSPKQIRPWSAAAQLIHERRCLASKKAPGEALRGSRALTGSGPDRSGHALRERMDDAVPAGVCSPSLVWMMTDLWDVRGCRNCLWAVVGSSS